MRLHLDASAGLAGDMLLAALIDAGAQEPSVTAAVDALSISGLGVATAEVFRGGFRARQLVTTEPPEATPAAWTQLSQLITSAPLAAPVRDRSLEILTGLAHAEARVHGVSVDEVHFHEVSGWDTLLDVVGTVAALVDLGVEEITCGTVAVGSGRVQSEHGSLPVPAPAVAELLLGCGAKVVAGPAEFEACSPTGAAFVNTLVTNWQPSPTGHIVGIGIGAGQADPATHANVCRVFLTESGTPAGQWRELVTNVDDQDPRLWPRVSEALFAAGAVDVWQQSITMKWGRPGVALHALYPTAVHADLLDVVYTETTSIGLRFIDVNKDELPRHFLSVDVFGHQVRVKVAVRHGRFTNVQPEWRDVLAASEATGIAAKEVLAEASRNVREDLAADLDTGDNQ